MDIGVESLALLRRDAPVTIKIEVKVVVTSNTIGFVEKWFRHRTPDELRRVEILEITELHLIVIFRHPVVGFKIGYVRGSLLICRLRYVYCRHSLLKSSR